MEEQPALISQPQEPLPARLNISLLFRVHGANKLAAKHDRVKLESAAEPVQCDICQDRPAVLFCSEDRALICRRYSCIHNLDCSSYCLKWALDSSKGTVKCHAIVWAVGASGTPCIREAF